MPGPGTGVGGPLLIHSVAFSAQAWLELPPLRAAFRARSLFFWEGPWLLLRALWVRASLRARDLYSLASSPFAGADLFLLCGGESAPCAGSRWHPAVVARFLLFAGAFLFPLRGERRPRARSPGGIPPWRPNAVLFIRQGYLVPPPRGRDGPVRCLPAASSARRRPVLQSLVGSVPPARPPGGLGPPGRIL